MSQYTLGSLNNTVHRIERDLYGNGRKGRLEEIEEKVDKLEDLINTWKFFILGAAIGGPFLAGSGTVSLKELLKVLGVGH